MKKIMLLKIKLKSELTEMGLTGQIDFERCIAEDFCSHIRYVCLQVSVLWRV